MNGSRQGSERPLRRLVAILLRAARWLISLVRELNYAQRRTTELFLARDGYLIGPVTPTGTYEEFLDQTAGRLLHEPSEEARLAGEPVRWPSPRQPLA